MFIQYRYTYVHSYVRNLILGLPHSQWDIRGKGDTIWPPRPTCFREPWAYSGGGAMGGVPPPELKKNRKKAWERGKILLKRNSHLFLKLKYSYFLIQWIITQKTRFNLHWAYITYSVKTWFLKILSVYENMQVLNKIFFLTIFDIYLLLPAPFPPAPICTGPWPPNYTYYLPFLLHSQNSQKSVV